MQEDYQNNIHQPFLCQRIMDVAYEIYSYLISESTKYCQIDVTFEKLSKKLSFLIFFLRGNDIPNPEGLVSNMEEILTILKTELIFKTSGDLVLIPLIEQFEIRIMEIKLTLC